MSDKDLIDQTKCFLDRNEGCELYEMALASGRFQAAGKVKTLGVLVRRAGL